jgi:hypothetical protein
MKRCSRVIRDLSISFMCESIWRFTLAGVYVTRSAASQTVCTGNIFREDAHPVGLAQLSKFVPRSQGPLPARPAGVGRPVIAAQSTYVLRVTHAREHRAQPIRLGSALQDGRVRPSRQPFRGGGHPVPSPRSTILAAGLIPLPLPAPCSTAPTEADAHAQARIFLGAQTQPATRSSQSCSRPRSAAQLVAAGPQS